MTKKYSICLFILSVAVFVYSFFTYFVSLGFTAVFSIFSAILGGISLGSAIGFGGIAFGDKTKKRFPIIIAAHMLIYFIMEAAAALSTVVNESYVVSLNVFGFAALPAEILFIILFVMTAVCPEKLKHSVIIIITVIVSVVFAALTVYNLVNNFNANTVHSSVQHLLIIAASFYPLVISGETK